MGACTQSSVAIQKQTTKCRLLCTTKSQQKREPLWSSLLRGATGIRMALAIEPTPHSVELARAINILLSAQPVLSEQCGDGTSILSFVMHS